MSTLNVNELKKLAKENNLLGSDYLEVNFQPSSYDLRIGSIFKNDEIFSKDFEKAGFTNNIDIKPSEIVSFLTLEKVSIPNDCMATVFSINRHSSIGLLILNPGHIDPGYSGYLSICAINLSKEVRTISLGESIFTLIVQKLNTKLNDNEVYVNKKTIPRKQEEELFLKTKSKKLSNSFFDLVNNYDGAKKMLVEKLWDLFWAKVGVFLKIIAFLAGIAGILKLGYDLFPDNMPRYHKHQKTIDSLQIHNDSVLLIKKNKEILDLRDSLKHIKN